MKRVSFIEWVSVYIKRRLIFGAVALFLLLVFVQVIVILASRHEQNIQFATFGEIITTAVREKNISSIQKTALVLLRDLKGKWISLNDGNGNAIWSFPDVKKTTDHVLYKEISLLIPSVNGNLKLSAFVPLFPNMALFISLIISTLFFIAVLSWAIMGIIGRLSKNFSEELDKLVELNKEIFIEELEKTRQKINELRQKDELQVKALAYKSQMEAIGQSTAMVAHDVRKPLASIKAMLSALPAIKGDSFQLAKLTANVDRNIAQTNALLNEILDFSRDSVVLDLKEHHPIDLITSALGNALRNNPKADVEIKYELNHQHKSLHVDGARITRIFTNIIDNALEAMFVNHNGKAFGVLKISTEWLDPFLKVTIANNGPSIPEDALPKIFDPFFTQGKEGGHGLGLAICKRVVDMHGGRIKARNKIAGEVTGQQGGVEFIIELLTGNGYAIVNESELIRSSKELEVFRREEAVRIEYGETINTAEFMRINKERGRQSYLLIVDDEPLFRESIRCLFNNLEQVKDHVKIVETDSTEKALAIFEAREFDYVITDIDLGKRKMNGYEFAQLILEKYPNTYVLIHSNKRKDELDEKIRSCVRRHSESDDAQECNSSKFMGFLPKPMKAAELLQFLACKSFETGSARQTKPTMSAKKVLLLNDDDGYNIGMKLTLKTVGIQILTATSVSDALKVLTENKLDGIISDINLGDGKPDGYEFLRGVREKDKTIPFIFASGYPKSDHWPKAEKLGATAYLQNPFETAELKGVLNI